MEVLLPWLPAVCRKVVPSSEGWTRLSKYYYSLHFLKSRTRVRFHSTWYRNCGGHINFGTRYSFSILIIVQRDANQSSLFIILQVHSTCFGCQSHPSSGVHKTVTTASGTVQLPLSNVATLEGGNCTENMTSAGGCSYSFVYTWWWVWLTPETCRGNLQNNK